MPMHEPGHPSPSPGAADDHPASPSRSSPALASRETARSSLRRGLGTGGGARPRAAARAHRPAHREEIDELLARIRELVTMRERLRAERAGERRIAARSAEIERLQHRLAEAVRRSLAAGEGRPPTG
jgi:hypothetical protein